MGQFLTGVSNSPYINGISYSNRKRLHVSGTYRNFIWYEGFDDPEARLHTVQAGPNGPENNYNLFYLYSDDVGETFCNSNGQILARPGTGESVFPDAEGLTAFEIPLNSGIMNQEAQAVDYDGGFHVLNRENEVWFHYYRKSNGEWSKYPLPGPKPTRAGARGDVVALSANHPIIVFALPGNTDDSLTLIGVELQELSNGNTTPNYVEHWSKMGFGGEPHLDVYPSVDGNLLSVFTRTEGGDRKVVVLDFEFK
jgi:hypothetical protein